MAENWSLRIKYFPLKNISLSGGKSTIYDALSCGCWCRHTGHPALSRRFAIGRLDQNGFAEPDRDCRRKDKSGEDEW
jgi:hypothetical protein